MPLILEPTAEDSVSPEDVYLVHLHLKIRIMINMELLIGRLHQTVMIMLTQ